MLLKDTLNQMLNVNSFELSIHHDSENVALEKTFYKNIKKKKHS